MRFLARMKTKLNHRDQSVIFRRIIRTSLEGSSGSILYMNRVWKWQWIELIFMTDWILVRVIGANHARTLWGAKSDFAFSHYKTRELENLDQSCYTEENYSSKLGSFLCVNSIRFVFQKWINCEHWAYTQ